MIVYVFIEVEGLEHVERIGEVNLPRDGSFVLENRQ